jgi:CelD/BcsL family acetyltransferase involved in cellulose biosynthesis
MTEHIEWVTDPARFAALEEPWDELAADDPTPFAAHRWFAAWMAGFGAGARLRTCLLWRDEMLAGVFPLWRRGRRLEAMAGTLHTPSFRPLARDGDARARLLEQVLAATDGGELSVEAIADGDPVLPALTQAARHSHRRVLVQPQHTSPIVDTIGEFEAYRQAMKREWRELERRRRKMHREHEVRYSLLEAPDDLDSALERGFAVESSGWKGAAGTAITSSPDTLAFYREIARSYHRSGQLSLSELWLDGTLVAFDLSLLHDRRLYLLKTGFDEGVRTLAPGLALRRAVIERCFERDLEALELLGDDMPWKRLFATAQRRHVRFASYGSRPVPLARYAEQRAMPALRRFYVRHVKPRVSGARA